MTFGRVVHPEPPTLISHLSVIAPPGPGEDTLPLDTFQECGHYLISWIARLLRISSHYRAVSPNEERVLRDRLALFPSQAGESVPAILADVDDLMRQGLLQGNHPHHFGDPSASASGPAILGEMLEAALGCSGSAWKSSSAAVVLTQTVLTWLRHMMGLPAREAFVCEGRSHGNLVALRAAVAWRSELDPTADSCDDAARLRIYASEMADPTLERTASGVGLCADAVQRLPVDELCRLRGDTVSEAIEADRRRGLSPCLVLGSVAPPPDGSTDALWELATVCANPRLWFHVDAMSGGGAAIAPEGRQLLLGGERADSLLMSPNSWLCMPGNSAVMYSRRPAQVRKVLSADPWSAPGDSGGLRAGGSFNALSAWFTVRCHGWDGVVDQVKERIRLARLMGSWVDAHPVFERLAPVTLSTVCFRARPPDVAPEELDHLNQDLERRLVAEGEVWLRLGTVRGVQALGFNIGGPWTEESHVRRAWALVRGALTSVVKQWQVEGHAAIHSGSGEVPGGAT
jgi:aromatic-L-amino-acid decarboxylase